MQIVHIDADCAYRRSTGSDNDDMAMEIKNVEDKISEVKNVNNVNNVTDIEEKLVVFERKNEGRTETLEKQYVTKIDQMEKNYVSKIEELDRKYTGKIEELENKLANTINTYKRIFRKKCESH